MRILSFVILIISSAITAGLLTHLVFRGWVVALAVLLGGLLGLFIAVLSQVADRHKK